MPDISFAVKAIRPSRRGGAPALLFELELSSAAAIEEVLLRCQIRIEAQRRRYSSTEQTRLRDLFGEPDQWGRTLGPIAWANLTCTVPGFIGNTGYALTVPCPYDLREAFCKYFESLDGGDVPVKVLFSGSVFYKDEGQLQVTPIPRDKEATYKFLVQTWQELMQPGGEDVDRIVRAVLYEGYTLYPYRPSSIKNLQRWNFGVLYPESWAVAQRGSDRCFFRTEVLAECLDSAEADLTVRFLHPGRRDRDDLTWEDADERVVAEKRVRIADVMITPLRRTFAFDGGESGDRVQERVEGEFEIAADPVSPGVIRIRLVLRNTSAYVPPARSDALFRSPVSASAVLSIHGGQFVSQTDPPDELKAFADTCRNEGVWPVLLGEAPARSAMLAAPVILPDYPQVADESPGDLFDGTEIDEILTLRILTLTDGEKDEIRASDERARLLLERAESLPSEYLLRLHGKVTGVEYRKGDRVRLHPHRRADILDIAFEGKIAIIEAIERDLENNAHLAVVLEDDPGRDLGELRQAGHRFFFSPEEVEPVA